MIAQEIQSNPAVLRRFARLLKNNRLAHAYLFIGPPYVGKSETALSVAKLVNCEEPSGDSFCGRCASCVKIEHGNHPDLHVVAAEEGETIKIEDVRRLTTEIQLRAFEGKTKVFILKNIETLTTDGSNALLKTLEEPTKDSLLILTTCALEKNLDTIKSRCHAVYFFPSSVPTLVGQLTADDAGADASASRFLAFFSEGCLGRAKKLGRDKLFQRKNEIIDRMIFSDTDDTYLKNILSEKTKTKEVLAVLWSWFRDLLLFKSGAEDNRLVHADRLDDLKKSATRYTYADIDGILQEIVRGSEMLEENLNIKVALSLIKEKLWRR